MDPGALEEAVVDGVRKAVAQFLHSENGRDLIKEAFYAGTYEAARDFLTAQAHENEKRRVAATTGPQTPSIQPPCSPSSSPSA